MFSHTPVLVKEVLEFLNLRPGALIVDLTVGLGGHAREIVEKILPKGMLIAMDQDAQVLEMAKRNLNEFSKNIQWIHGNFRGIDQHLKSLNIHEVDGILMDLGVSSYQLDDNTRGFSFLENGPLDMRMNRAHSLSSMTAREVLNHFSEEKLANILFEYGQERYSRPIAKAIVKDRKRFPFETTLQLARLIEDTIGFRYKGQKIHSATRTFQALRIYVNDELGALEETLFKAMDILKPQGRLVVISFHSLEDGMVKRSFRKLSGRGGEVLRGSQGRLLTRKPVRPSPDEVRMNDRARSAMLRAIEKRG
ncbi:MAG: 16S rRNA (cytosine(1402)-N(4))-methyltransferase RsmH [Chlamydiae bacterium]|nr:16S rRNA (cytosine(1402)-N(4))-methyltransferase RsmH [Chlamydiota bacterium]MBI3276895.1 16S rRNA (cytosine(1402)-N(4))-methyltransferase RsmH [Chlamydiota bacterium]